MPGSTTYESGDGDDVAATTGDDGEEHAGEEAEALVQPCNPDDPNVAWCNGWNNAWSNAWSNAKQLPKIGLDTLETLLDLALTFKFSAMEADKAAPSEKLVSQTLAEARQAIARRGEISVGHDGCTQCHVL